MLSRETVFVLGAGASYELNLPLGEALRDQISELLDIRYENSRPISGDLQIDRCLHEIAGERPDASVNGLLHKCWLIRDALPGAISIDNLLDAHRNDPEVSEVGKLAIAKAILSAERGSALYDQRSQGRDFALNQASGSYLIPLFQMLTEGIAREDAQSVFSNASFIVFNYDRTLEYFFPRALATYYGLSDSEANALFDQARIIHPYGRVGEFGRGKSLATASFGAEQCDLRSIAAGIRTFSEGLADVDHALELSRMVEQASQIVFLGFAFHPLNMEILKPADQAAIDKVFGTTLKLSDAAVRSVERDMLQTLDKIAPDASINQSNFFKKLDELNLEPRTAADFLQAHFRGIA